MWQSRAGLREDRQLQHLAEHAEMCDYSPANLGIRAARSAQPKDSDAHMRESCDYRAVGICESGWSDWCSLIRSRSWTTTAVESLKAHNGALQGKVVSLDKELKKQLSNRLEREKKSLLAQLSAVHNELQMTAIEVSEEIQQNTAPGSTPLSRGPPLHHVR